MPSRNFPRRLYCALTDELVNRSLREVRQHMKGRKFTNAKGARAAGWVRGWEAGLVGLLIKAWPVQRPAPHTPPGPLPPLHPRSLVLPSAL